MVSNLNHYTELPCDYYITIMIVLFRQTKRCPQNDGTSMKKRMCLEG